MTIVRLATPPPIYGAARSIELAVA